MKDFATPSGPDLLGRTQRFLDWQQARRALSLWSYGKSTQTAAVAECAVRYDDGTPFSGVNLASQDYLGLSSHAAIVEAARNAMYAHGVHSGGSGVLMGASRLTLALEAALCDFMHMEHAVLFPTGWAAGYGAIQGLVRADDHVVIDERAHACLQQSAFAATRNIHHVIHLDLPSLENALAAIRSGDTRNAILVVTASLFSMDSDTPDIEAWQTMCTAYGATLLVDVAHDLGAVGADGRGRLGAQNLIGKVDLVVGSFSKTFATNGGFVLTQSAAVKAFLTCFASTHIFSSALSPLQAAVALAALAIVRSPEGVGRRRALAARSTQLRAALSAARFTCFGNRSPILPVHVGDESLARLMIRALPAYGVVANLVEHPGVCRGAARLRLQLMATHSADQIRRAGDGIIAARDDAMTQLLALRGR